MVDNSVYARVVCQEIDYCGGPKFLTKEEYKMQMNYPDRGWRCPNCHGSATWDDDYWETHHL